MFSGIHSHDASGATRFSIARIAGALAVALALIFGGGCTLLSDNLEKAAKAGGKIVKSYCENVTIPEVRDQIRDAVNAKAAPHKVEVTCADEAPAPAPTGMIATKDPLELRADLWDWFSWFNPIFYPERTPIVIIENA